jgi:5-methylcytosine-specific restriction endonuclease McrA
MRYVGFREWAKAAYGIVPPGPKSGPRVEGRLPQCEACGEPRVAELTQHHLVPRAAGGRGPDNTVTLCARCHRLVHRWYGPGNDYAGPTERGALLAALERGLRR